MKIGILMRLILPVLGLILLLGCEKHGDESYFKSKCTAQINGQSFIDQTNVKYIFSPIAQITPFLKYYDEGLSHFMSHLKTERDGELKYMCLLPHFQRRHTYRRVPLMNRRMNHKLINQV